MTASVLTPDNAVDETRNGKTDRVARTPARLCKRRREPMLLVPS